MLNFAAGTARWNKWVVVVVMVMVMVMVMVVEVVVVVVVVVSIRIHEVMEKWKCGSHTCYSWDIHLRTRT